MLWQGALMNAAAVTACFLAVLGPGLSLSAQDCSPCFYRQTPPRGPSSEALSWVCHSAARGQAFATLRSPTCDTAVLSAFRVGHVGAEGEESVSDNEDVQVLTPALLQGDEAQAETSDPPADSPLRLWDSSVTAMVRSSVGPRCSSVRGDLYVLTGRGRLGGGDEGCDAGQPFWSAMCCDVSSDGEKGFSAGLLQEEAEGGEGKLVSMQQLEEMLGVTQLFSEGCGRGSGRAAASLRAGSGGGLLEEALTETAEHQEAPGTDQDSAGEEITEQAASAETQAASAEAATQTSGEGEVDEGATPRQDAVEEQSQVRTTEARAGTEPGRSAEEGETAAQTAESEQPTEEATNSTVIYLISTAVYVLTLPLRPVVSTITNIPGQVAYVLQEDLWVLSRLPGDTAYMLYFTGSGVVSWMRWVVEVLLDVVGGCGCGLYHCSWAMMGELLGSCYTGVAGLGTLAGDSLGVAGDVADNAWWVTRQVGGRVWEHSKGYAGSVGSEMGGQAATVGGGLGTLVWRSLKGVFHTLRFTVGVMVGTVRLIALGVLDPPTTSDDAQVLVNNLVNAE